MEALLGGSQLRLQDFGVGELELVAGVQIPAGFSFQEPPHVLGCMPMANVWAPELQCRCCLTCFSAGGAGVNICKNCRACCWCSTRCCNLDALVHSSSGECAVYAHTLGSQDAFRTWGSAIRDFSCALRLLSNPIPLVSHTEHILAVLAEDKSQQWLDGALDFCVKAHVLGCTRKEMEQALCAVIVNAVEVHGSDLPRWAQLQPIAVYKTFCRINHSCRPSARYTFLGHDGRVQVQLLTNLSKGGPLTITYVDALQPRQLRQAELFERYAFVCKCERCLEVSSTCFQSDTAPGALAPILVCASTLLFEKDQAEQCFLQCHDQLSDSFKRLGCTSTEFTFLQILTLLASAACICARLSSCPVRALPWWSRAMCCRLLLCSATEGMVSAGETGILAHAAHNRAELSGTAAEAQKALTASLGTQEGCWRSAHEQQANAFEGTNGHWTGEWDRRLWSAATKASGVSWEAWPSNPQAWTQQDSGQQQQPLHEILAKACSALQERSQSLAKVPWLHCIEQDEHRGPDIQTEEKDVPCYAQELAEHALTITCKRTPCDL